MRTSPYAFRSVLSYTICQSVQPLVAEAATIFPRGITAYALVVRVEGEAAALRGAGRGGPGISVVCQPPAESRYMSRVRAFAIRSAA